MNMTKNTERTIQGGGSVENISRLHNDEKEFEEWKRSRPELLMEPFDVVDVSLAMRLAWLASRRTLREQIDKQLEKEGWEDKDRLIKRLTDNGGPSFE